MDCYTPTKATLLPFNPLRSIEISNYREEMVIILSTARALTIKCNHKSQCQCKQQNDNKATTQIFHIGDWVLAYFPQDETGKHWLFTQPWHGPYRIMSCDNSDLSVIKMYFPEDPDLGAPK